MFFLFLIGVTFLSLNSGQTQPALSSLTDLAICNSYAQGFVSDYDEGIYFDVSTIPNASTVAFNACINNSHNFNSFEFSLALYEWNNWNSFFNSSVESSTAYASRPRCGDHDHAGTYLQYTNSNNYNGSYILQIKAWTHQGGSYKITKDCNVTALTSNPTPSPTNLAITDTFTCGDVMSGSIQSHEWVMYKVEGIDFNASCGSTYAFDACPQQVPYVNNMNIAINVYDVFNGSDGLHATGLSVYGDVKTGSKYCNTNNDKSHGVYFQFTDTQCGRNEPPILYLSVQTLTQWSGVHFAYEIEFLCDTQMRTTPSPTLPYNVDEISCDDNVVGIYNNSEVFYSINTVGISANVAFDGCLSNFDVLLTVYEVANGSSELGSHGASNRYVCNENEAGNYLFYAFGINAHSTYYLGVYNYDECFDDDCQYDVKMGCSNFETSTKAPTTTTTKAPTITITPAPTQLSYEAITCSSRDLMGDLRSTTSLRNTYRFYNSQPQFVLFSFCSMAHFESKIFLYKENNDATYDVISSSATPSIYDAYGDGKNAECLNITGYFDSGDYWLAIEAKRNWHNEIVGLPVIGEAKYLLNVYCATEAITKSESPQTPKVSDFHTPTCNFVQFSKYDMAAMPIGVCNTKYPDYKSQYPFTMDDNDRYSYKAECKADKSGLQVTICPYSQTCGGNSCFTVDAQRESQCENDAALCDFTVYDYHCESSMNCEYTTIRISGMADGPQPGDVDFSPVVCDRDEVFYETISMIVDECYVKKGYGWISSVISCDGLNSITINDYLIPFETTQQICSAASANVYNYNATTIRNGGCVYAHASYVEITHCPYTASPTESTYSTEGGMEDTATYEPTPTPTDIVGAASSYSAICVILIAFMVGFVCI